MSGTSPQMNDWCAYQERKTAPKPSYKRPRPPEYGGPAEPEKAAEPPSAGIEVQESSLSDTIIDRMQGLRSFIGRFRSNP
jgi:hypothetical protein